MPGPSGAPVLGVSCFAYADRTEEVLDAYVVGIRIQAHQPHARPPAERPHVRAAAGPAPR